MIILYQRKTEMQMPFKDLKLLIVLVQANNLFHHYQLYLMIVSKLLMQQFLVLILLYHVVNLIALHLHCYIELYVT